MKKLSMSLCVLAFSSLGLTGCEWFRDEPEGPVEELGREIDDGAEDVEDSVEDLGEEIDESTR
jgi:hypothetical protein